MKNNKLAALCKRRKTVLVIRAALTDRVTCWLSDGLCCYPVKKLNLPDKESVFEFLGLPLDKADSFSYLERTATPEDETLFGEFTEDDEANLLTPIGPAIAKLGETYIPFWMDSGAVIVIPSSSLSPMSNFREIRYSLRRKRSENGEWFGDMIAVKQGLLLEALIQPAQLKHSEDTGSLAQEIVRLGQLIESSQILELYSALSEKPVEDLPSDPEINVIMDNLPDDQEPGEDTDEEVNDAD